MHVAKQAISDSGIDINSSSTCVLSSIRSIGRIECVSDSVVSPHRWYTNGVQGCITTITNRLLGPHNVWLDCQSIYYNNYTCKSDAGDMVPLELVITVGGGRAGQENKSTICNTLVKQ